MSAYGARQFVAWLTVSASFDGRGFSKGVQQRLDATQDEADKALVLRDATFRALYSTPDPIRQLGHLKACRRLVGNLVSEQSAPAPGHDEIYREEMQGVVARGKALLDNAERGGLLDVRGLQRC